MLVYKNICKYSLKATLLRKKNFFIDNLEHYVIKNILWIAIRDGKNVLPCLIHPTQIFPAPER